MRIERRGKLPPLTPRVEQFLREKLDGVPIDDLVDPADQRADFICLEGSLVVELKTLEGDASERLHNAIAELQQRPDWPIFFGAVPVEAYLKNLGDDAEPIRRKLLDRVGRSIVRHLHKANRQLASETARVEGKPVRLLLLIIEDHADYDPQIVSYVVMRELQKLVAASSDEISIDGVIYLSERHATVEQERVVLPLIAIRGPGAKTSQAKTEIMDRLMDAWAEWNGCPVIDDEGPVPEFGAIDVVPDVQARSDQWRLEYHRSPYMSGLTERQLTEKFDEVVVTSMLWALKSSPRKLSPEAVAEGLKLFTHVIEELNRRHIPMQKVQQNLAQLQQAARRLQLGEDVVEWLARVAPWETDQGH